MPAAFYEVVHEIQNWETPCSLPSAWFREHFPLCLSFSLANVHQQITKHILLCSSKSSRLKRARSLYDAFGPNGAPYVTGNSWRSKAFILQPLGVWLPTFGQIPPRGDGRGNLSDSARRYCDTTSWLRPLKRQPSMFLHWLAQNSDSFTGWYCKPKLALEGKEVFSLNELTGGNQTAVLLFRPLSGLWFSFWLFIFLRTRWRMSVAMWGHRRVCASRLLYECAFPPCAFVLLPGVSPWGGGEKNTGLQLLHTSSRTNELFLRIVVA